MGVDLNTYRCRIGTFTGHTGHDVVTLCVYLDLVMAARVIGCPICIGLLLLIAGIEPNPGPWLEICYIAFVLYVIFMHFLNTKMEEDLRARELAEARRKPSPPTKPYCSTLPGAQVSWRQTPGVLKIKGYEVHIKGRDDSEWTYFMDVKADKTYVDIADLNPDNQYQFKVRTLYENRRKGPFSEPSDSCTLKTPTSNLEEIIHLSILIPHKGHICKQYQLPVIEDKSQTDEGAMTRKCVLGTGDMPSMHLEEKTILVVGDDDTSVFIDGLVNYLYGVQWNDNFRFHITEFANEHGRLYEWITSYTINPLPQSDRQNFTLTVITTGKIQNVSNHLRVFLLQNKIEIDAIYCLSGTCSPMELSVQMDAILSATEQNVRAENRFVVSTSVKEINQSARSEHNSPSTTGWLKLNISSLFENEISCQNKFGKWYWTISMDSYKAMVSHLGELSVKKSALFDRTLNIREWAVCVMSEYWSEVHKCLETIVSLESEKGQIESTEFVDDKVFQYAIRQLRQNSLPTGEYVLFCLFCGMSCHSKCKIPDDKDIRNCSKIAGEFCSICPEKCKWTVHKIRKHKTDVFEEKKETNFADFSKRYQISENQALSKNLMLKVIEEKDVHLRTKLLIIIQKLCECSKALQYTPIPLTPRDIFLRMIKNEEHNEKAGSKERLNVLRILVEIQPTQIMVIPESVPPSKPKMEKVTGRTVSLSWKTIPGALPLYFEVFQKEKRSEWIQSDQVKKTSDSFTTIKNLKPSTTYQFKVTAVYLHHHDQNVDCPSSEASDDIETYSVETHNLLSMSRVISSNIYQLPVFGVKHHEDSEAMKVVGTGRLPSWEEDEKTVLFLGDVTDHKDSAINGLVNYLYGVDWEDDFRLKLVDFYASSVVYSRGETKEESIVSYTIHALPESERQKFTLTVIDTPGYDITNTEKASRLSDSIQSFLKDNENVHTVDAVCFVIPLSHTNQIILPSIPEILSEEKTFIFTSAVDQEPLVVSNLKHIPCRDVFHLKNGSLFAKKDITTSLDQKLNYDMGMERYSDFVSIISQFPKTKRDSSTHILNIRSRLINMTLELRKEIDKELELLAMENRIDHVISNDADCFNNSFTTKTNYQKSTALDDGNFVTFCLICNRKCHYPCDIPENQDMQESEVIDKNHCTVCPGKCHWCIHKNIRYNVQWHCKDEEVNCENRYGPLQTEKLSKDCIALKIAEKRRDLFSHIQALVVKVLDCCNYLRQISLNSDPLNAEQLYQLMIQSEDQERKSGYSDRIATLKTLIVDLKEQITDTNLPYPNLPKLFPPTRPKCTRAPTVGIDVSWKVVPYMKDARSFEVWKRETNTSDDEWIKSDNKEDDNSTTTRITKLQLGTEYEFRVRAIYHDEDGPFSEPSDPIRTHDGETTKLLSLSRLLQGKRLAPTQYCLPEFPDLQKNSDENTESVVVGTCMLPQKDENEKIVLIVGPTSSGKTTLIEGLINYLYGAEWEGDYRFRVEGSLSDRTNDSDNSRASKTEKIKSYKILPLPNNERLASPLTVIDTPGLETKDLIARIQNALPKDTENKGQIVDAVCFVMKSPVEELKETEQIIFKEVLSLFKRPVKILGIETFAGSKKSSAITVLKNEDINASELFAFNNSSLFESKIKKQLKGNWLISMESYKRFISCVMDGPVMRSGSTLVEPLVQVSANMQYVSYNYISKHIEEVIAVMEEVNRLKDFQEDFLIPGFIWKIKTICEYEITRPYNATVCTSCKAICHELCAIPKTKSRAWCCAMENNYCMECPLGCHWTKHDNSQTIREWREIIRRMTYETIMDKYNIYKNEKIKISELRRKMNERLGTFTYNLYFWFRLQYECDIYIRSNDLNRTTNIYTFEDYLRNRIVTEQAGLGYDERIKTLELVQRTEEEMIAQNQCPTSNSEEEKIVLMVGKRGGGKSALIDGLANYLYGVDWEDDFRYKLTGTSSENHNTSETTEWITSYTIYPKSQNSSQSFILTVFDTPGFDDCGECEQNEELVGRIQKFFSELRQQGKGSIDAVCFVTPSQITNQQTQIFDFMLSIFGKDIKDNLVIMATFANENEPPLKNTLHDADLQYTEMFKFNNGCLFENNSQNTNPLNWSMNMDSFHKFILHLLRMPKRNLQLTSMVMDTRAIITSIISKLHDLIHRGLKNKNVVKKENDLMEKMENEIQKNERYTYKISTKTRKYIYDGTQVTNCSVCEYTCHDNCSMSDDQEIANCMCITRDYCTVCPGKCYWKRHRSERYKWYQETTECTDEDMKRKYDTATQEYKACKQRKEGIITEFENGYETNRHNVHEMLKRICKYKKFLSNNALKASTLTALTSIDRMIQTENKEQKTGYMERVEILNEIKQEAELLENENIFM